MPNGYMDGTAADHAWAAADSAKEEIRKALSRIEKLEREMRELKAVVLVLINSDGTEPPDA